MDAEAAAAGELVEEFWRLMAANDFEAAGELFADDAAIDWVCSGERIRGGARWAELQRLYPASGGWRFDVHRIVAAPGCVVSEVTVCDDSVSARVVAFSTIADGLIESQTEYWPVAYEPPAWRVGFAEPIEAVP